MADVTLILSHIEGGDRAAAEQLLPLVYDELRRLAFVKLAQERPGQTLQATALVHEAYLRLTGVDPGRSKWDGRAHFFAAAAEAMRRILVEEARRKNSAKRGDGAACRERHDPHELAVAGGLDAMEALAIHEGLDRLAVKSPRKAELVKLRYFLGCTMAEAAEVLGIALGTAEDDWTYAKAWLRRELDRGAEQNRCS